MIKLLPTSFLMASSALTSAVTILEIEISNLSGDVPAEFSIGQIHELTLTPTAFIVSEGSPIVLVDSAGEVFSGSQLSITGGSLEHNFDNPFEVGSLFAPLDLFSAQSLSGFSGHRESILIFGQLGGNFTSLELSAMWADSSLMALEGLLEDSSSFLGGSGSYSWSSGSLPIHPLTPLIDPYSVDFSIKSISVIPEPSSVGLASLCLFAALTCRTR